MSTVNRRIDANIAQKIFGYNVLWATSINGKYEPHTTSEPFGWKQFHYDKWDNFPWIIPHFSSEAYPSKLILTKMKLDGFSHKLYHLALNRIYVSVFTNGETLFKYGSDTAEKAICLSALSLFKDQ